MKLNWMYLSKIWEKTHKQTIVPSMSLNSFGTFQQEEGKIRLRKQKKKPPKITWEISGTTYEFYFF